MKILVEVDIGDIVPLGQLADGSRFGKAGKAVDDPKPADSLDFPLLLQAIDRFPDRFPRLVSLSLEQRKHFLAVFRSWLAGMFPAKLFVLTRLPDQLVAHPDKHGTRICFR